MTDAQPSSQTPAQIVALPGDGIGPEVMNHALRLLTLVKERLGIPVEVQVIPCGGRFYLQHGSRDWPEGAEEACSSADLMLLGAVGHADPETNAPVMMADGRMAGWSAVIGNRTRLELFANVRPVKLFPGVLHRVSGRHQLVWSPENVDLVIVRENTEDLYAGMGGTLAKGEKRAVSTDTRIITRAASERVIRFAFELARDRRRGAPLDGLRRVTCVHKHNVLEGCRLFCEVFDEISSDYPDIDSEKTLVDTFSQRLIMEPERFDICVTTNMFGDILTDLASVLQGGLGLAVGCNIGLDRAMFEPIHGSAPDLAGRDAANPMAMILAMGEGMRWLGRRRSDKAIEHVGDLVEASIKAVIASGRQLPADLVDRASAASMSKVARAIEEELELLLG